MKVFAFMYKSFASHLQTPLVFKHHNTLPNLNHCLITPFIRSYTTKNIIPTNEFSEYRTQFLENKCGLSGKALITASKYLTFDSSNTTPDSVLDLFRTFGFPQPNITQIVSYESRILQNYHPQNVIMPKLDFLLSKDLSHAEVVAIVTKNPRILTYSLNKVLIPSFDQLQTIFGCNRIVVDILKYSPYSLTATTTLLPNIQFLLAHGVPNFQILTIIRNFCRALYNPHDKFCKVVLKIKHMDFDLSSSYFIKALRALSFHKDSSTWESRRVLLKSFGFSNNEVLSMFKKLPGIMSFKDNHINEKIEFFLKKLQWTPSTLSRKPDVVSYSLEKRTIPRCSVLQVLVLQNSTSVSYNVSSILAMTEIKFIKDFVTAHKDKVPELMEAYQGKLKFDKYTFKQKGLLNQKPSLNQKRNQGR